MTPPQLQNLKDYIDLLGPSLMDNFSVVKRDDNPMQWNEVHNALKGHLRTAFLKTINETMGKLRTVPSLQGKLKGMPN